MNTVQIAATALVLTLSGTPAFAESAALTESYLYGRWSLDGEGGCASPQARYVLFRDNGSVEVGRGNTASRVGFWKIVNGDTIVGHTLSAPLERKEYHPFFRDTYRYEYMSPRVESTRADSFTVTVGSDLDATRYTLTRCPAPGGS